MTAVPMIVTKCATCPISAGCGGNPHAPGRCLRGDDLAEIYTQRAALVAVSRSLIGAISIIEHTPECKKAMPSDKMFNQMLKDMKKNLEMARKALLSQERSDG
jgi:hypothetical protein